MRLSDQKDALHIMRQHGFERLRHVDILHQTYRVRDYKYYVSYTWVQILWTYQTGGPDFLNNVIRTQEESIFRAFNEMFLLQQNTAYSLFLDELKEAMPNRGGDLIE